MKKKNYNNTINYKVGNTDVVYGWIAFKRG